VDDLDVLELEAGTVNERLGYMVKRFADNGVAVTICGQADMDVDAELNVVGRKDLSVQVTLDHTFVVNKSEGEGDDWCLLELGEFRSVKMAAEVIKKEMGNACA
jgi:hypothetical protein